MHYHYNDRGHAAGRLLKSLIVAGGDRPAAAAYARSQGWHDGELVAKSAISGLEASGADGLGTYADEDFLAAAWPLTLLGKMTMLRRGSFTGGALNQTGRPAGAWKGQSAAAPMSVPTMQRLQALPAYKVTALTVATLEALEEPGVEQQLGLDLARAVALVADAALIDGSNTDGATRPASITFGAQFFASTGDVAEDASTAIAAFGGSLTTACWLTHPAIAAGAGLQLRGAGPLGALGGTLAGLPVYTSEAFELDTSGGELVLVDQAGIQVAGGDRAELRITSEGVVEMDDDPTGRSDTPTAASANLVSLWQSEGIAMLGSVRLSWRRVRSGSVVVIGSCEYSGRLPT